MKKVPKDKREPLDDIAKRFVSTVTNDNPQQVDQRSVADLFPVVASTSVQYDETGKVEQVGKTTIHNKGFKLGMYVASKAKHANITVQWKIVDVHSNGTVELATVLPDGSLEMGTSTTKPKAFAVELDTFINDYKPCTQITFMNKDSEMAALDTKTFTDVEWKSMVYLSLRSMMPKLPPT